MFIVVFEIKEVEKEGLNEYFINMKYEYAIDGDKHYFGKEYNVDVIPEYV